MANLRIYLATLFLMTLFGCGDQTHAFEGYEVDVPRGWEIDDERRSGDDITTVLIHPPSMGGAFVMINVVPPAPEEIRDEIDFIEEAEVQWMPERVEPSSISTGIGPMDGAIFHSPRNADLPILSEILDHDPIPEAYATLDGEDAEVIVLITTYEGDPLRDSRRDVCRDIARSLRHR